MLANVSYDVLILNSLNGTAEGVATLKRLLEHVVVQTPTWADVLANFTLAVNRSATSGYEGGEGIVRQRVVLAMAQRAMVTPEDTWPVSHPDFAPVLKIVQQRRRYEAKRGWLAAVGAFARSHE